MKALSIIVWLLLLGNITCTQNLISVEKHKSNFLISFKVSGENFQPTEYFLAIQDSFTNGQKLLLIEELLRLKGDSRYCSLPIKAYSPYVASLYHHHDAEKHYSIQVQALFLINQIYFLEPFRYSPYPVLVGKDWTTSTTQGPIIDKAFKSYIRWFRKVNRIGLVRAREKGLTPLSWTKKVRWYR